MPGAYYQWMRDLEAIDSELRFIATVCRCARWSRQRSVRSGQLLRLTSAFLQERMGMKSALFILSGSVPMRAGVVCRGSLG